MRLFFAVELPAQVREKIAATQAVYRAAGARVVQPENLHLTVAFLGERTDSYPILLRTQSLSLPPPFMATAAGVDVFRNGNDITTVWIGVGDKNGDMVRLQEGFQHAFGDGKKAVPHITVARVPPSGKQQQIRDIVDMQKHVVFGEWVVNDVVLKKSTLIPAGPVYETVGTSGLRRQ